MYVSLDMEASPNSSPTRQRLPSYFIQIFYVLGFETAQDLKPGKMRDIEVSSVRE